ncbi:unnamed protein product [Cylindrotheca closterium]|uniref:Uncharacterized protein n=1 Tax=Cylindrotheca closterium TaxID=2856 RepID=A0AAD2CPL7_9STRA|nr:unnamed protein product [Cylindrotheca closterium]
MNEHQIQGSAMVSMPVSTQNANVLGNKTRSATSDLSNPAKRRAIAKNIVIKPADYVKSAFKANGFDLDAVKASAEKNFSEPTEAMLSSYTSELLANVRKNNMEKLRQLHAEKKLVNSSNKFGESLLHLSCRRSFTEMTKFLIFDVKVDLNIRDDYFRTPLHDACWTPEPNFELVELLIKEAPEHLLLEDVRGFTPFDYVRTDHWKLWLRFLWERRQQLRPKDPKII